MRINPELQVRLLGRILRRRRKEEGLSQAELAKLCNTSPNNVSRCETGESSVRWTTVHAFCMYFKIENLQEELEKEKVLYRKELKSLIDATE